MSFYFNAPPTTETYTLSLHDALPISVHNHQIIYSVGNDDSVCSIENHRLGSVMHMYMSADNSIFPFDDFQCYKQKDRKSTRLNSSHMSISYAVFCLKKKKT